MSAVAQDLESVAMTFPSRERLDSVLDLFREQTEATPARTALIAGDNTLTYEELNDLSNRLSRRLASEGIGPDSQVAVLLPRSLEMPVAVLGVLKAGAAYVPIDPRYPDERMRLILEDSRAQVLITCRAIRSSLPAFGGRVLELDSLAELGTDDRSQGPARAAGLDDLAYVIYTSGSTGRPKGVAMVHRAMANLVAWQNAVSAWLPEGARTLQFSALSFDVSFQEMFCTWTSGGALVLVSEEVRRDPAALWQLLTDQGVHRIFLPFVALQQLAEAATTRAELPATLREVITAGEPLLVTDQVVSMFRRLPGARLHNQYGPTETHVVTALTLDGDPGGWPAVPSIGRPIAHVDVRVLDGMRRPVPPGVEGEIYVGGACLARGYLHQPALTAERFLPEPGSSDPTARWYRTGDLGRVRANGEIEFLGRIDDQVKIRGFRVELGEVESGLRRHASVKECAVNAWLHDGEKRLVAYVVPRGDNPWDERALRDHCRSVLPEYMRPGHYVKLDRLPVTPSGKVDRRGLPVPVVPDQPPATPMAGGTQSVEEVILGAWRQVLGVSVAGGSESFFDLGGTSLMMVRVQQLLEHHLGRPVPVALLFQHPTVASLALHLGNPMAGSTASDSGRLAGVQARAARQRQAVARRSAA